MKIRRVMLVDDEPDIRKIGQMSLERVGRWETLLATSGKDAVELAQKERVDLILLDVMMPGMDGPTTYQKLRELPGLGEVPIVFLTAKVQQSEVERYLTLGAVGVLRKPFDPLTLPQEIRKLLGVDGD